MIKVDSTFGFYKNEPKRNGLILRFLYINSGILETVAIYLKFIKLQYDLTVF